MNRMLKVYHGTVQALKLTDGERFVVEIKGEKSWGRRGLVCVTIRNDDPSRGNIGVGDQVTIVVSEEIK